jgi:ribose transport system permease protein
VTTVRPGNAAGGSASAVAAGSRWQPRTARLLRALAFDRIGAVYVWLAIIVVFSIWAPETFPQVATAKQVVDSYAVTGLAALAITIPLCARVFDLSFAAVITLTGVATARLVTEGIGIVPAVAIGLLLGLAMGLVNAIVVVVMKIDSFIGTLATGLLMGALVTMITHDTPVSDPVLFGDFSKIGQTSYEGITLPVLYMTVIAVAIWYLLEHTATGRRLYATGFNPDAARLAGVRVDRLRFTALLASGFLSGACGIVLASTLSSGSPTAGAPYLLPAFAAAFLGATQLKHGRFNAWGTVIAVLLLGTGITGLQLAGAPPWARDMFVGIVLIASLAVTGLQRRGTATGHVGTRRWRRRTEPAAANGTADVKEVVASGSSTPDRG